MPRRRTAQRSKSATPHFIDYVADWVWTRRHLGNSQERNVERADVGTQERRKRRCLRALHQPGRGVRRRRACWQG